MGISLYSLHVPSSFGGRAKLDISTSPIFVQDVLAALSWQQEELGPEPCMSWAFPSPQWSSLPYQGWGHFLTCGPRSPERWVLSGSVHCKCYSSLSQHQHTCPRVLEQEGLVWVFAKSWGIGCGGLAALWGLDCLWYATCAVCHLGPTTPCSDAAEGFSCLSTSWPRSFPICGSSHFSVKLPCTASSAGTSTLLRLGYALRWL